MTSRGATRTDLTPPDGEVITSVLFERPWRPPDDAAENRALTALAEVAFSNPAQLLFHIASLAAELCRVDSAAVALLEADEAGYRWAAAAGRIAPGVMNKESLPAAFWNIPRESGSVQLFADASGVMPSLRDPAVAVHENLLALWKADARVAGALWVVATEAGHHFDSEDARLLESFSRFAFVLWQLATKAELAKVQQAERRAALNLMEDAVAAREAERRENANRRRAEQELRESEEWLKLSLKSGKVFTWKVDPATGRVEYSENVEDVLGFKLSQRLAENLALVVPEDREEVKRTAQSAMTVGTKFEIEYRIAHPQSGEILWVGGEGRLVKTGGSPALIFGVTQNITKRKQAEEIMAADLADMRLLRDLGARLTAPDDGELLYGEIVETAIALARADGGTVRVLDSATGELVLLAASGFSESLMNRFQRVSAGSLLSCGIALAEGRRSLVDFDAVRDGGTDGLLKVPVEAGYLCAQSTPLVARSGKIIGMLSTYWRKLHRPTERELRFIDLLSRQISDLMEQQSAEKALRENEERMRRALSIDTVGVLFFGLRGRVLDANEAFLRLSGYTRGDLLALSHWERMTPPEFVAGTARAAAELMERGETAPYEKELVRPDGSRWWGLFAPTRLSGSGLDSECVEFVIDITANKAAGMALKASEERLRMLFESMSECFVVKEAIFDEAGRITDYRFLECNPAFSELTGLRDTLGRTMRELLPGIEPVWMDACERVLRSGHSARFEAYLGPLKRWLGVSVSRIGGEGSGKVAVLFRDISDRKQAEQELLALKDHLAADLAGMTRLYDLNLRIARTTRMEEVLQQILAVAIEFTGMDRGHIQLTSTGGENLTLAVHQGHSEGFIEHFRQGGGDWISEKAVGSKSRVIVGDISVAPGKNESGIFFAEGIRSIQSTPLLDHEGTIIGMLSTHSAEVLQPDQNRFRRLDLLAWMAADAIVRSRMEDSLRESEKRLRTLADAVPQIIWTNDGWGAANYFNQRWYEYSGLTRRQSTGVGWQAIVHRDDAVAATKKWEAAVATGKTFEVEFRLQRGDGLYRWFIARNIPLRNDRGETISWFGTATDIHDLKEAQALAREREEQFRRAIEDAPIPVIMHADDGQILAISRSWTLITGYAKGEVSTFNDWLSTAYGTGVEILRERMDRIFSLAAKPDQVEFEIVTRSGEHRHWIFSISAPGTLRDGRRFAVGMGVDVTERKRAETALAASQEWLRLIVESAQEHAIFSTDLNRCITSWSAGAERMLGYAKEEVLGRRGDLIFTPEDQVLGGPEREAELALISGRAADERWHVRKNGSRFWGSGVMMPMRSSPNSNIIGFVKIFRDETEKREALEALKASREVLQVSLKETEQARAEAQLATEAKDRFIAVLSHELRTPLTPVMMASHILARRKDLPAPVRDAVNMIRTNVQLEAHLVDDLLDVTRIASGKMELNRTLLEMHAVIQRAVEITAPEIDLKGQKLVLQLEATETAITGDATRLQQVVWNLLKNASKFTPPDGEILLRTWNGDGSFALSVTDSGIGIEKDALVKIFDAFTQANAGITREFGGLGLGLSISKAAVVAHGGELSASSEGPGRGATFTVLLPFPPVIDCYSEG